MPEQSEITTICEKAIPLPDCPISKKNAIARRVWLKLQIENLLNAERARNRIEQGVAEDANRKAD